MVPGAVFLHPELEPLHIWAVNVIGLFERNTSGVSEVPAPGEQGSFLARDCCCRDPVTTQTRRKCD